MHETSRKGDVGVASVMADLLDQRYEIMLPVSASSPFDLAVLVEGRCLKVQVKYAAKKNCYVDVHTFRNQGSRSPRRRFRKDEVDVVAVYCPDTRSCYYVWYSDFGSHIRLRIDPIKNNSLNLHDANLFRQFPTGPRRRRISTP